ncbi:MAG TPA: bacteriohopanetetrol glucosamine biosynthesis glycosyltransferase HpnI [Terriglobales bacterium]|nr:bacteriohopanetetrol glucosamine biosynthesis glycosyltransferase HpnI [Terriglobales bacterium]
MGVMVVVPAHLFFWRTLFGVALVGIASSTVFLALVVVASLRYRRNARREAARVASLSPDVFPPISILKPVHGVEERLEQNLESFFRQDYPNFEIVFGARSADNEALLVVEKLRRKYPQVAVKIVLSGEPVWPNAKVYSLEKMIAQSAHDFIVISDSDIWVSKDAMRNIVAPLLDNHVGLVTCIYRGVPSHDFGSGLEALGMSIEMTSGVVVADMLEGMKFALGAIMATRKDVLPAIGGISATKEYYSDDFVLGNLIAAAGYKVVLSHQIVGHVLVPRSLGKTMADQLRWMKSTRFSRPKGHVGSGLTFSTPYGLLALIAGSALSMTDLGIALFAWSILNRIIQSLVAGWGVTGDRRSLTLCWLYPVRDFLGFFLWVASFNGGTFFWRGEMYRFEHGGRIVPEHRSATVAAEVVQVSRREI